MASSTNPPPPAPPFPPIRACLFDMDGLLIDSEDKYTICTNTVLQEYGRPLLPWHIKAQLQGRPGPQAGKIFEQWAQLPVSREVYMRKVTAMQKEVFPDCRPLPGVEKLLRTLSRRTGTDRDAEGDRERGVEMALATSSHAGNFALKTTHLSDTFSVFDEEHRVLGDDPRIPPGRGKPAPDIYLLALETINARLRREGQREIEPAEALVFEDSVPGVEAGRRAGMQVVWCPHPELLELMSGKEELILAGLMGEHQDDLKGVEHDGRGRRKGAPGEIADGWGRLVRSVEEFPYEEYGIRV